MYDYMRAHRFAAAEPPQSPPRGQMPRRSGHMKTAAPAPEP